MTLFSKCACVYNFELSVWLQSETIKQTPSDARLIMEFEKRCLFKFQKACFTVLVAAVTGAGILQTLFYNQTRMAQSKLNPDSIPSLFQSTATTLSIFVSLDWCSRV